MAEPKVFFSGAKKLDKEVFNQIKTIINEHMFELMRGSIKVDSLKFTFKEYKKDGEKEKPKYSVHLMVNGPAKPLVVSHPPRESLEWDAVKAVHDVLDKAMKQMERMAEK